MKTEKALGPRAKEGLRVGRVSSTKSPYGDITMALFPPLGHPVVLWL